MKAKTLSLIIMTAIAGASLAAPAFAEGEGNVKKGKKVFKKCKACHQIGEGAENKVGPHLNNVFGRVAGSFEDYKYSKVMIAKGAEGLVWDAETLDGFLKKPKKYMKGTKMSFNGTKKDKKRLNLIAYLKSFSPDAE